MEPAVEASPLCYRGYIPGLDVLRGVAILMVLLYHGLDARVPWQTTAGWARWPLLASQYGASGVQLFFVLSGFLITSILLDTAADAHYYRKFYVRRALRILPAYILMLSVLRLAHVVSWKFILAAMLYIANMAGLVGAHSNEYGALWSLAVEEQFYLLWPVIVRRLSLRSLTRCILTCLVAAAALRIVTTLFLPFIDASFKLWFNADLLMSGALVAIGVRTGSLRRDNITPLLRGLAALSACFWLLTIDLALYHPQPVWQRAVEMLDRYIFLFGYTALLLVVLRANRGVGARAGAGSVAGRVLAFFGYISYGLYLVHQFVFDRIDRHASGTWLDIHRHRWSLGVNTLLGILLSIAIAYLSRRFFEEQFLRRKDRIVPYQDPLVNERPPVVSGEAHL